MSDTRAVAKSSLLITILVIGMLAPVIVIAWTAKWIYGSRRRH